MHPFDLLPWEPQRAGLFRRTYHLHQHPYPSHEKPDGYAAKPHHILNESGKDGVQRQRTISLRDSKSNQIVAIGFEDNIDLDYCDAIFYVHIAEKDAIDEGVIPELPTDPEGQTDEDN